MYRCAQGREYLGCARLLPVSVTCCPAACPRQSSSPPTATHAPLSQRSTLPHEPIRGPSVHSRHGTNTAPQPLHCGPVWSLSAFLSQRRRGGLGPRRTAACGGGGDVSPSRQSAAAQAASWRRSRIHSVTTNTTQTMNRTTCSISCREHPPRRAVNPPQPARQMVSDPRP